VLAVPEAPAKVLETRDEIASERRKLRSRAALSRIVDVSDKSKKARWLERSVEKANSARHPAEVAARTSDALHALGGPVNSKWGAAGDTQQLLARVQVPGKEGDDKEKGVVVRVGSFEQVKQLIRV
jgi:hypothetical protein